MNKDIETESHVLCILLSNKLFLCSYNIFCPLLHICLFPRYMGSGYPSFILLLHLSPSWASFILRPFSRSLYYSVSVSVFLVSFCPLSLNSLLSFLCHFHFFIMRAQTTAAYPLVLSYLTYAVLTDPLMYSFFIASLLLAPVILVSATVVLFSSTRVIVHASAPTNIAGLTMNKIYITFLLNLQLHSTPSFSMMYFCPRSPYFSSVGIYRR